MVFDIENNIDHLKNFMQIIIGDRNPVSAPENHKNTVLAICERWKKWGINAEIIEFEYKGYIGRNLWVPPKNIEKTYHLLIAHHDTVPNCPGADDNGSGMLVLDFIAANMRDENIALLMPDFEEGDPVKWEIFNEWQLEKDVQWFDLTFSKDIYENDWIEFYLKCKIKRLEKTEMHYIFDAIRSKNYDKLISIIFTNFLGTRHMISHLGDDYFKNAIILNFESVGYTSEKQKMPEKCKDQNKGDFIIAISNKLAKNTLDSISIVNRDLKLLPYFLDNIDEEIVKNLLRRSDHAVFWDMDLPAIVFTDTIEFRNDNYHKKTDTNVDFEFIEKLCLTIKKFIL